MDASNLAARLQAAGEGRTARAEAEAALPLMQGSAEWKLPPFGYARFDWQK